MTPVASRAWFGLGFFLSFMHGAQIFAVLRLVFPLCSQPLLSFVPALLRHAWPRLTGCQAPLGFVRASVTAGNTILSR